MTTPNEKRVRAVRPIDVAEVLRWCTLGPNRFPHENTLRDMSICNAASRVLNEWATLAPDLRSELIRKLSERVLDGTIDPNFSPDRPPLGTRSEVMPGSEIEILVKTQLQWERDHWVATAFNLGYDSPIGEGRTRSEALMDLEKKINVGIKAAT